MCAPRCPAIMAMSLAAAQLEVLYGRSVGAPRLLSRIFSRTSCQFVAWRRLVLDSCSHHDLIRTVTPSARGCQECLKTGS
jgi:hypothetical protein